MGRLTVLFLLALVVSVVSKRAGGSKGGFSWGKAGGSSNKGGSSNSKGSSSQGSHSAPANYPRQPQVPNQNPPPYPGRGGNPAPGGYPAQGGYPPQGGYPAQGGYPPQGGYPAQGNYPGRSGYPGQGGYPAQGSYPGGSYPNRNPGQAGGYGNPYPGGGSYPGYPNRGGSYPGGGVAGAGAGAYPGAAQYPYWNPNNKIMSPGYGGNYGGQGYGGGRSPFAQSVQNMGMAPSYNSRGFGRQAVMAAGVGAVAGMALGYGLGSFPRPHFNFHNPQEEYYYNNYMYRRYGQTPPNGNVNQNGNTNSQGGRPVDSGLTPEGQGKINPYDIFQNTPPQSFDNFMDKCIKRTDLLRQESRSRRFTEFPEPEATLGGELGVEDNSPRVAQEDAMSNNSTVEKATSETSSDTTSFVTSKLSETQSQPQRQIQEIAAEDAKEDDDTVSIMEIGYPVLIEQMKARRCVELYMVYAEQHAEKQMQQRSNIDDQTNSGSGDLHGPLNHGVMLLLTSILACYL
ncbi:prisilkin-39-like [Xyrauchen texanus]|uniref:prisilkin-39-like n=1 Tax=Xyrauchen texanus TaxID=154827 RepID=UPI002241E7B6|nr:prisilkin-39-like [Xyrauchen texanus]